MFEFCLVEVNSFTIKAVVKQERRKREKREEGGRRDMEGGSTYEVLFPMKGCVFTTCIPIKMLTK